MQQVALDALELADDRFDRSARAFDDRRIAVMGLGYVGLPLAISFVESGLEVEGIDVSERRVMDLTHGRSPIDDVPPWSPPRSDSPWRTSRPASGASTTRCPRRSTGA